MHLLTDTHRFCNVERGVGPTQLVTRFLGWAYLQAEVGANPTFLFSLPGRQQDTTEQCGHRLGVLFGCFGGKIDGDSWFTRWTCFFHLPGKPIYFQPKRTPMFMCVLFFSLSLCRGSSSNGVVALRKDPLEALEGLRATSKRQVIPHPYAGLLKNRHFATI